MLAPLGTTSGRYVSMGALRSTLPSSTSCRIAVATNVLVILPIRKCSVPNGFMAPPGCGDPDVHVSAGPGSVTARRLVEVDTAVLAASAESTCLRARVKARVAAAMATIRRTAIAHQVWRCLSVVDMPLNLENLGPEVAAESHTRAYGDPRCFAARHADGALANRAHWRRLRPWYRLACVVPLEDGPSEHGSDGTGSGRCLCRRLRRSRRIRSSWSRSWSRQHSRSSGSEPATATDEHSYARDRAIQAQSR